MYCIAFRDGNCFETAIEGDGYSLGMPMIHNERWKAVFECLRIVDSGVGTRFLLRVNE